MIYVIGDYGDGHVSILGDYESEKRARGAINWQGSGSAHCEWHNRERATVKNYGRTVWETTFYICKPTSTRGEFVTIEHNNTVCVTGTCLIKTAHEAQLDKAQTEGGRKMNIAGAKVLKGIVREPYAWPGAYEKFAIASDGATLCHKCCKSEFKGIMHSTLHGFNDGWQVTAVEIVANVDGEIECDHCGNEIQSSDL